MKYLLSILILGLVACEDRNVTFSETDTYIRGRQIKAYVIGGCEYIGSIMGGDGQADFLTHKGNCKYCIQRQQAR